jgi:hypothetical protein
MALFAETIYFTPQSGITKIKPRRVEWSNQWRVPLLGSNAPLESIFEGQWNQTFYQNHRSNDVVADWINVFNKNPFSNENPLNYLLRCTGDHPNQHHPWNHPTCHSIHVVGTYNGPTVGLDFSHLPLQDDQFFAAKLCGDSAYWEHYRDDVSELPQRSFSDGSVLRKKTSPTEFCRIHFSSPNQCQCFALLLQGPGIGSSNPHQYGSILCLYYVIANVTEEWYDILGMQNLEKRLLALKRFEKLQNLQRGLLDSDQRQATDTAITDLQRLISQLIDENFDFHESNRDLRQRKERLQRENCIRDFIGEIPELQNFTPENIDEESRCIGKGCSGEIYPGRIRNTGRDIIIKKPNPNTDPCCLQKELDNSETLKRHLKARLSDLTECPAKFQGFSDIVTVLGQTADGHLVQERVYGQTLYALLHNPQEGAFYDKSFGGFPRDIKEAKRKALALATIIQSIHSLGMFHNDLSSFNIMLDDRGHVRVIDLGFCGVNSFLSDHNDIFREMGLLCIIFFGTVYIYKFINDCLRIQWWQEHSAGQPLEQREAYLLDQFRDFNQQMRDRTGKAYSDATLERLSRLTARMADPNPDIRPASKEICEELTEIWLLPED